MTIDHSLLDNRWFAQQPQALRDAIIVHGRTVVLAEGQTAYLEGDEGTGLWFVTAGSMRLEMAVGPDRNVLIAIIRAGMMFGRTRAGGADARIVSATADRPSRAFLLSDRAIARITADHVDMWRAMNEALLGQLDLTLKSLAILLLPPRARVAARLQQMAQHLSAQVRQSELAELTGLSRKVVNGHLRALQHAGLIDQCYGAIRITDLAGLTRQAEGRETI